MSIQETVKTQKWYYIHNTRSAYFPINSRLHRERERLCPSMKWWKHRNGTISIIQDLHISLSIGDCIERERAERERERLCPSVKQWKHRNCTICIIQDLHISLSIGDCIERESKREREAMSIHEMLKTQKWYYIHNMRSWYFPISRRLHREREGETMSICETVKTQKLYCLHNTRSAYFPINIRLHREREQERERLCPSMKQWKHRNSTMSIIQDLHISLSIGDCIERARESSYVHLWNGENTETVLSL